MRFPKFAGKLKSALRRRVPFLQDNESMLIDEAQSYWNESTDIQFATNSHWRGNGPFSNDQIWLQLGQNHLSLLRKACQWCGVTMKGSVVVEYGCGGGMNAFRIAPIASRYFGIDVSSDSLAECNRQVKNAGAHNFSGIQIETSEPDHALERIAISSDIFLCTYVFELLPTPEYGLRVLEIAERSLKVGGIALIQIRYHNGEPEHLPLRHNYRQNAAQMTTYRLDEFWTSCKDRNLEPVLLQLLPDQPELREHRYAYYILQKGNRLTASPGA